MANSRVACYAKIHLTDDFDIVYSKKNNNSRHFFAACGLYL